MKRIIFNCNNLLNFKNSQRSFIKLFSSDGHPTIEEKIYRADKNIRDFKNGPGLKEFLIVGKDLPKPTDIFSEKDTSIPYLNNNFSGNSRKIFFDVYGCQMNTNDTEVIWSILQKQNYLKTENIKEADVILVVTCAIREGAETKIWNRLKHLSAMKKNRSSKKGPLQIGILGCMAERLKTQVLEKEKLVDIVAGPDSYKDLPRLLKITKNGPSAVNVLLSLEETYADVMPVRLNQDTKTAFISIMRGCENMCTYCIVPFTRGKERSRPIESIENEVKILEKQGIKEITLLGQNVNSYRDLTIDADKTIKTNLAPGFNTVYKTKVGGARFAELLERIATAVPEIRIRFTSPHPKDFPKEVLETIKKYPNICNNLHLPVQSGSSTVLERMRRGYTREAYLDLVSKVRSTIPNVALSSDFICGFCGETEEEFNETLTLIREVKYNVAFLFAYSMREKTTAHRRYKDDIPMDVKTKRLQEMITVFRDGAKQLQSQFVGKTELVLVEGASKRSELDMFGRNDANIKVILSAQETVQTGQIIKPGDYVAVLIESSNSQILKGNPLYHSTITEFYKTNQHPQKTFENESQMGII